MSRSNKGGKRCTFQPDYAVAPGRTLEETVGSLGIDQRELAARTGLSFKHVNQIIRGVAPISQDTAIRLERVTGVPARVWNNLEVIYREQLARIEAKRRLEADLQWLKTIPAKELIQRGAFSEPSDKVKLVEAVLCFFGVASVDAWNEGWLLPQFAFRKSLAFQGKPGAMAAWLRLGELEAQSTVCQPFSRPGFRAALDRIRGLTVQPPEAFIPQMRQRCADNGVAVTLVPEIKQAPVSGAAKWLTPVKAMICLNLRGKTNDRFWFTFFHEAGHLLNDSKKETFIDAGDYADDERERIANQFAADLLIPPRYAREFPRLKTCKAIAEFARSLGIAPGIVVGRLQHDAVLPHSFCNELKQRLAWTSQ